MEIYYKQIVKDSKQIENLRAYIGYQSEGCKTQLDFAQPLEQQKRGRILYQRCCIRSPCPEKSCSQYLVIAEDVDSTYKHWERRHHY